MDNKPLYITGWTLRLHCPEPYWREVEAANLGIKQRDHEVQWARRTERDYQRAAQSPGIGSYGIVIANSIWKSPRVGSLTQNGENLIRH